MYAGVDDAPVVKADVERDDAMVVGSAAAKVGR